MLLGTGDFMLTIQRRKLWYLIYYVCLCGLLLGTTSSSTISVSIVLEQYELN